MTCRRTTQFFVGAKAVVYAAGVAPRTGDGAAPGGIGIFTRLMVSVAKIVRAVLLGGVLLLLLFVAFNICSEYIVGLVDLCRWA